MSLYSARALLVQEFLNLICRMGRSFSQRRIAAWGRRRTAVLDYLARYVFRIALTNARIVGLDEETVNSPPLIAIER